MCCSLHLSCDAILHETIAITDSETPLAEPLNTAYEVIAYYQYSAIIIELNYTSVLLLRTGEINTPKQVTPCP